jgi:hypothetical protein
LWLFPKETKYDPGTAFPSERIGALPVWALGGSLKVVGIFSVDRAGVPVTCCSVLGLVPLRFQSGWGEPSRIQFVACSVVSASFRAIPWQPLTWQ